MPIITSVQYQAAYDIAKRVHLNELSLSKAAKHLSNSVDMGEGSAKDYLVALSAMWQGRVYKRTLKIDAYRDYFERFSKDLSAAEFCLVIISIELHLDYYASLGRGNQPTVSALVDSYRTKLALSVTAIINPDEVHVQPTGFNEGAIKQVTINAYERDSKARAACIAKFGATCQVCDFDFEKTYGEIGKGFIHVHHKIDIATIGKSYQVDPINDLVPVCPNCHTMLHTETPAMAVEQLKITMLSNSSKKI
jgi:5-methylcytosine-specific restriction protein A